MPNFLQRRGKLSERSGGDRAPVSVLLRAATLRCKQSLRELEASWSFRGDTGTARRAPPWFGGIKKRESRKYSPSLRQTRGRCVVREQRRLKRDKYKGESSCRVQVISALRSKGCADGIRTWKQQPRVGGSERPGQMQAEKEKEEAIEEKRYNFTALLSFFASSLSSASRGRAHLGGALERAAAPVDPALQPPPPHAPRRLHFAHLVILKQQTWGFFWSCLDGPSALTDALCLLLESLVAAASHVLKMPLLSLTPTRTCRKFHD